MEEPGHLTLRLSLRPPDGYPLLLAPTPCVVAHVETYRPRPRGPLLNTPLHSCTSLNPDAYAISELLVRLDAMLSSIASTNQKFTSCPITSCGIQGHFMALKRIRRTYTNLSGSRLNL